MSSQQLDHARYVGDTTEAIARDRLDLSDRDTDRWSEEYHDATDPRRSIPVEVKAGKVRYANGNVGGFRLWKGQHEKLKDAGGYYVLVAHDGDPDEPERVRAVDPEYLDEFITDWWPVDHRSKGETEETRIRMNKLFPSLF